MCRRYRNLRIGHLRNLRLRWRRGTRRPRVMTGPGANPARSTGRGSYAMYGGARRAHPARIVGPAPTGGSGETGVHLTGGS